MLQVWFPNSNKSQCPIFKRIGIGNLTYTSLFFFLFQNNHCGTTKCNLYIWSIFSHFISSLNKLPQIIYSTLLSDVFFAFSSVNTNNESIPSLKLYKSKSDASHDVSYRLDFTSLFIKYSTLGTPPYLISYDCDTFYN